MSRLDIAFMGRNTALNPITVKSARRIEHDAKWRRFKDRVIFAAVCAIGAAVCYIVAVLVFAL
jgi:hypothetical protein